MPKNPKKEPATETDLAGSGAANTSTAAAAAPQKKTAKSAKTPARKAAAKKSGSTRSGKKTAIKRSAKVSDVAEPSDADIRLRAYFIAERRVQLALQGDPAKDWLDAKQQLLDEARQGPS
ncbi:MAG: hypothetical protein M3372_02395 [Verrucomicrobiota bacterium]|nr:hypothetical protein [Verrucomicrobiota bacterium]